MIKHISFSSGNYNHSGINGFNTLLLCFIYLFVSYWNLDSKYHDIKLMITTDRPQRIFGSRCSLKLDSKIIQLLLYEYRILHSTTGLRIYFNFKKTIDLHLSYIYLPANLVLSY